MAENKGTPISLKAGWDSWRELHRTDPGEFWHSLLFVSFWLHIAFFPLGYGFREVMPCINFIFLLLSAARPLSFPLFWYLRRLWSFLTAART